MNDVTTNDATTTVSVTIDVDGVRMFSNNPRYVEIVKYFETVEFCESFMMSDVTQEMLVDLSGSVTNFIRAKALEEDSPLSWAKQTLTVCNKAHLKQTESGTISHIVFELNVATTAISNEIPIAEIVEIGDVSVDG